MITYRHVVYDVIEDLKQTHDDLQITPVHVLYWVQLVLNRLRYERLKEKKGGLYLTTFYDVAVVKDEKGRKYFDLPKSVYDMENEEGIDYVTYCLDLEDCCEGPGFVHQNFYPTTPSASRRLYFNEYEKPAPKNPYFWRVGERIYLLGVECVTIDCVEIGVFSALDPSDICDLDEEIPLSGEMIHILRQEVMKIGRFSMYIPKERINDGADGVTEGLFQAGTRIPQVPNPQPQQQEPRQ